jgi:hypothetical protein
MENRNAFFCSCHLLLAIQTTNTQSSSEALATTNPLLAKWEGPYGGVPPFDRVQVDQFKPALETGMAESLQAVGGRQ